MNKKLLHKMMIIFGFGMTAVIPRAHAGYSSYPPLQMDSYNFFEDSDNAAMAAKCIKNQKMICAAASFLPIGVKLATNDQGIPMLIQGLFFSRTNSWKSLVSYNLTLVPDYTSSNQAISNFKTVLSRKYGIAPEQVDVSPVDIGTIQFIVRQTFGTDQDNDPKTIAAGTHFTQTIVPQWSGDFHQLGSRFSVNIQGPIWDLEPALQNMLLHKAGNGIIGQVSFTIPVKATTYDASIKCNVQKFQQTVKDMVKSWRMTRITRGNSTQETFNNDERTAVLSALKFDDYCDIRTFVDNTHKIDNSISQRQQQLFDTLFKSAFKLVDEAGQPDAIGGRDAKYTSLNQITSMDASGNINLNLKTEQIFNLSSDLDFYAGAVTEDNLDPTHKYICYNFEKFDLTAQKCVYACNPGFEVYQPKSVNADANGCVDITKNSVKESL